MVLHQFLQQLSVILEAVCKLGDEKSQYLIA